MACTGVRAAAKRTGGKLSYSGAQALAAAAVPAAAAAGGAAARPYPSIAKPAPRLWRALGNATLALAPTLPALPSWPPTCYKGGGRASTKGGACNATAAGGWWRGHHPIPHRARLLSLARGPLSARKP